MTQPNPQPLPPPKTQWGQRLEDYLDDLDRIGKRLFGGYWEILYQTLRDAIALAIFLKLPGFLVQQIVGEDFSGFDVCYKKNPSTVTYYACYFSVLSDHWVFWTMFVGVLVRQIKEKLKSLKKL
ncbi:MAG: hypothetical protein LDL41_06455 [Coleofasciculus sp. S288]|nr:hypothetical protein [Coleofasciculus sp. S288]